MHTAALMTKVDFLLRSQQFINPAVPISVLLCAGAVCVHVGTCMRLE